jgi:hypothetical protein
MLWLESGGVSEKKLSMLKMMEQLNNKLGGEKKSETQSEPVVKSTTEGILFFKLKGKI